MTVRLFPVLTLLSLASVSQATFLPAVRNAMPWSGSVAFLPTGAVEFDVDVPRPKGERVLHAEDFGVSETKADNSVALRSALAAAKAQGVSRLDLKRGTYRFARDWPLDVDGFMDFTFDGNGSTFVSHRRAGCFAFVQNCVRTRLVNFSIDWDWTREPLASVVRVVAVAKDSFDVDFVDYDKFPDREALLVIMSPYDPTTRSVGVEGRAERFLDWRLNRDSERRVGRQWLDGNSLRIKAAPLTLKLGELYRLQHYYYHMDGFWLVGNRHLRLENVNILSTPGHALYMEGKQHHVLFRKVNIAAPKGELRRVITCTADHLHINRSQGFVKLEDCEFSLGADDIFNMHDVSAYARVRDAHTVRTQNSWAFRSCAKGDRVELRREDFSPSGFFGTLRSVKAVDARKGVYDVSFDEDILLSAETGVILFNWAYDTHNVIVRNCRFHDNRARGLLVLARDVTIENNVFRHQDMGAVKLETGYTFNVWSEGYGVSNVVIRGNVFENTNPSGSSASHLERTIYAGIYMKKDPSTDTTDFPIIRDVLIEDNLFRDNFGVSAYLSSVSNVIVRNNRIEDRLPRKSEKPYRSQFRLVRVRDAKVVNNVFAESPCVKSPGVDVDSSTCMNIVVGGNVVVPKAQDCGSESGGDSWLGQ